jgi:hypothetical protein
MKLFTPLVLAACMVFIAPLVGCAPRMTVATGTTIGLNATPGDGQAQSPQVTFAYKRSEIAKVPTGQQPARKPPARAQNDSSDQNTDAYSAIAIVDFQTKWFGKTSIDQFIATGHAARDIQEGTEFTAALAYGPSFDLPSKALGERIEQFRKRLFAHREGRNDLERERFAAAMLALMNQPLQPDQATEPILDWMVTRVGDDAAITRLENAFMQLTIP